MGAQPIHPPGQRERGPARLAYLSSNLPGRSQTFVYQEILGLRTEGARVLAATMRRNLFLADVDARLGGVHAIVGPLVLARAVGALARRPWSVGALAPIARAARGSTRAAARNGYHAAMGLALSSWLRAQGIEYLHAHHAGAPTTVAMVAARAAGIPFGFTAHGSDVRVAPMLLGVKAGEAEVVVAASESTRGHLAAEASTSAERIEIVRCGVPLDRFRADERPTRNGRMLRALAVGRLSPEKDHVTMVRAFGVLRDRDVPVRLDLVGEGPERARIEHEIDSLGLGDRVRLLGGVTNDRLPPIYERADLFVHSSVREGLPVVLVEALAAGLPVATTGVDGIPELVRDGEEGVLVDPGDPGALAGAVSRLADDELRARMARNGPPRALVHDLGEVSRRLIELFPVAAPTRAQGAHVPVALVLPPGGSPAQRAAAVSSAVTQQPFPATRLVCVGDPAPDVHGLPPVTTVRAEPGLDAGGALVAAAHAVQEPWLAPLAVGARWYPHALALLYEARPDVVRGIVAGAILGLDGRGDVSSFHPPAPVHGACLVARPAIVAAAASWDGTGLDGLLARVKRAEGLSRCERVVGRTPSKPGSSRRRRQAARYAADGLPSIAVASSVGDAPSPSELMRGRELRRLPSPGLIGAVSALLRRPAAAAFVGRTSESVALRLIGVRPLRADRGESQTRGAGA